MDVNESRALIEKAGGPAQFGRLLGIDERPGWLQRVCNWNTRGIPASVALEHYETLRRLREGRATDHAN